MGRYDRAAAKVPGGEIQIENPNRFYTRAELVTGVYDEWHGPPSSGPVERRVVFWFDN